VGLGGVVRVGDEVAPAISWGLHSRLNCGEGGSEMGRVAVRVILACPMGMATNLTRPQCLLRAVMKGKYFLVLASSLVSHPKSLQKPISIMMRVHAFLLKEVWSGFGESRTPPAYMRSGAVPFAAEDSSWISTLD